MKRLLSCVVWTAILTIMAFARADYVAGPLYDNVAKTLTARYYDSAFRAEILPKIAAELRPRASNRCSSDHCNTTKRFRKSW